MSIEMLPDPEGIRNKPGGRIVDDKDRAEAQRCAEERADAMLKVQGARLRGELYNPSVVAELAFGTVGLMLADVMNGEIKPKDAKQAIEIARIALQISDRLSAGNILVVGDAATDTTADRAAKIARKDELLDELRSRATKVLDEHRAADHRDGVDLSDFDLDDDEGADRPSSAARGLRSVS